MKMANELNGRYEYMQIPLHIAKQLPPNVGLFVIRGHCMELAGIYDGDAVIIDFDRRPRNGDPCLCIIHGKPFIKAFDYTKPGGPAFGFAVSTRYNFLSKNFKPSDVRCQGFQNGYFASEIGGVVLCCFSPSGELRWLMDYHSFSTEVPPPLKQVRANVAFAHSFE